MSTWSALAARKRWLLVASTSSGAVAQTLVLRVILIGANLATGVIVARVLAPTGRGEQAAMVLWPGILCGLLSLGIPLALSFKVRRQPEQRAELLSAALILGTALGFLATVVGIVVIPHWIGRYDRSVVVFAQWAMLIAPLWMVTVIMQAAFEADGDFTASNVSKFFPPVTTLCGLIAFAALGKLTPYSSAALYLGPAAVVPLMLGWRLRRRLTLTLRRFRTTARELLSYGIRSYAVDVLGTLSQQVDQLLVVGLVNPAGLGIYTVALSASRVLGVFHNSLNTVLFPKASSLEHADVVALTARAARINTLITASTALVLFLILPLAMPLVYGRAFNGVIPVTRILLVEIVLTGAASILAQAFMATGKPGVIAVLQTVGLLLAVPLMFAFIPRFGLSGAALALLVSTASRLALVLVCYPLVLKTPVPNMVVNRSDLAFLANRLRRTT